MSETKEKPSVIRMNSSGLVLSSLDDAWRFATMVCQSGLAPRDYDTPDKVLVAVQFGSEIGLRPMQSLQSIAVVNGRPSLYGDALPALAWASGVLEEFREWFDGPADELTAHCVTRRKGQAEPYETTFSVSDAKRAGLWDKRGRNGKPTPWVTYPRRMLQMRARAWNFRANLADVLSGINVAEEAMDIPADPVDAVDEFTPTEPLALITDDDPAPETEDSPGPDPEPSADVCPKCGMPEPSQPCENCEAMAASAAQQGEMF